MNFNKGYNFVASYPVTNPMSYRDSGFVSVLKGNMYNVPAPPTEVCGDYYHQQTAEVIQVRCLVAKGIWPADFLFKYHPREDFDPNKLPPPLLNEGLTTMDPAGCANVVHMDSPNDMPKAVHQWLLSRGTKLRPSMSHSIDFLGAVPYVEHMVAERVYVNLRKAFEVKYYYGMARPEEACGAGPVLTAYPEGCPRHPAYPQGHGAAASAVSVFNELFELTSYEKQVIWDCAYFWSQFRVFAGVHYPIDALASFILLGLLEYTGPMDLFDYNAVSLPLEWV